MSDALSDLPSDVAEIIKPHLEADASTLAAIGVQIAQKRDEAKTHRASSGIETTWKECEEAYLGIDAANRHEWTEMRWAKPMSMEGPVTTNKTAKNSDYRSTAFLRLTSRYVDAGVAKLAEILLPADEKAFSFDGMPVPELLEAKEDDSHVVHGELGVNLTRPVEPGETPPPDAQAPASAPPPSLVGLPPTSRGVSAPPAAASGSPGATGAVPPPMGPAGAAAPPAPVPGPPQAAQPPRVPLTVRDLAMEAIGLARKKAKAAETRIYDWMVETQYRAEIRKVIADAARIGVGVLKAPTPRPKRAMAITDSDGDITLEIREKIIPASEWVDPWDIFPDPSCGENIHDGDYVFQRQHMSARQVRGLKKEPGYISEAIDRVLEEGPNKINTDGDGRALPERQHKNRFEVWFFYGQLTKDELAAIDHASGKAKPGAGAEDDGSHGHCIVTLINDSVVRSVMNPLDSGEFPYHSMPWQRRAGHWAGVGVAEQMRTPQRVTNAALRALLNNAGKSAGSQFFLRERAFKPADGAMTVTPDKFWYITEDGSDDIRKDFAVITIPNVTAQLLEIITLGERFAEETTSIPLIAQGQSGATTPDTFGAAQLQNNNANQLLRSIGYSFDDFITEPVVRQYYEWLLMDPSVPKEEKGEFQIDAHGSIALVERAIQDQSIAQMGNMAANPIYGVDPKKWARLFLKSKRLNPEDVQYTDEEQAKLDANPPPEAPAVTVAKINADTQLKLGVMKQQVDQQTVQHEAQIAAAAHALEVAATQTEQQKVHGDLTMQAHQIDVENQRAQDQEVNKLKIALDQAKTELAKVAMQLQTERDLHQRDMAIDLHKHHNPSPAPPVQLPGRAGNGRAFEQGPPQ